jgi:hypothetical protein
MSTRSQPPRPTLTVDQAHELAGDLMRQLTPMAGDPDKVRAHLMHWLDTLSAPDFDAVCIATVWRTFSECLTPTPLDAAQVSRLPALIPPRERTAS